MRRLLPLLLLAALAPACSDGGGGTAGVAAPDACTGPVEAPAAAASEAGEVACPTCPGAPAPAFALPDFQPFSCAFGQAYGLERFRGRVTVVALLAAW